MVSETNPKELARAAPTRRGHAPLRRRLLAALAATPAWAAGLGVVGLAGCARREPMAVGLVVGLSGTAADLGSGVYNGVLLAVEETNAAGGVAGRAVELLVRDDRGDAELVRRHVEELAERGVQMAIGPATSSMALAALPAATARGLVLLSPSATSDELSGRDDAFFRIVPALSQLAAQHAEFLYRQGARRVAVAVGSGNDGFSGNYERVLREVFTRRGGTVGPARRVGAGTGAGYGEVAAALLAEQPDTALTIASTADTALLMHQLRQGPGPAPRWLSSAHWGDTPSLLKAGGAAVEGVIVTHYFDPLGTQPTFKAFAERYRHRFGAEPGFAGVYGYDAARYGLAALARCGNGRSVKECLLQLGEQPGLQGPVAMDRHGDGTRPVGLAVVRQGRVVALAQ